MDRYEAFTGLFIANQNRIYGLIFTLVPDHTAAQDILQDTGIRLWQKFDSFEEGTDFGAWALKVTRFVVMEWQRSQKRVPLPMGENELHDLADSYIEIQQPAPDMHTYLDECLSLLTDRQRDILRLLYKDGRTVIEIAAKNSVSRRAVHKMLRKTKDQLLSCIQSQTSLST